MIGSSQPSNFLLRHSLHTSRTKRDGVLELSTVHDRFGLDQRRPRWACNPEAGNRAPLLAANGQSGEH
jgi:hypothetical protein